MHGAIFLVAFVIVGSAIILMTSSIVGLVIKTPGVRVLIAFLIWAALIGFLGSISPHGRIPPWRINQSKEASDLTTAYMALQMYKGDHDEALPERFSQLLPEYLADANIFFDRSDRGFKEHSRKAAADPTEVDRNGQFEYFAGKTGGMLAACKAPIEKENRTCGSRPKKELVRVILETDGSIKTVPEEEYQRRLNGGTPANLRTP